MREGKYKKIEGSSSSTLIGPLPSLPNEIIEEILLRLPTKSLLRFTSLSKKLETLISNHNFTKTHLNRLLLDDEHNNHHRLLVKADRFPFSFYSSDYESLNSIPVQRTFPRFVPRGITICGSCHGLLLACLNARSLYLWNPSLNNNIRRLPRPNWYSGRVLFLGLGYDSSIDDYKVIRAGAVANGELPKVEVDSLKNNKWRTEVEVYSLKTNKWRTIANGPLDEVAIFYEDGGTFVNGSLYWCISLWNAFGEVVDKSDEAVLGFDLTNETFSFLQLPYEEHVPFYCLQLSVLRGRLAVNQHLVQISCVVVWIFEEGGENNEFVWTKLMKIPDAKDGCGLPICCRKSGEMLLCISSEQNVFLQLVLYDEKNHSCKKYLILDSSYWRVVHTYLESLVAL